MTENTPVQELVAPVDEDGMPYMLQPYEVSTVCYHRWDKDAGASEPDHNGVVRLFDVCVDCGASLPSGRADSVL